MRQRFGVRDESAEAAAGRRAALLGLGLLVGLAGSWLKIPMSAFGVAFIGNVWALTMFGVGLLVRGYATPVAGIDIAKIYVPHGFMVGAGIVTEFLEHGRRRAGLPIPAIS